MSTKTPPFYGATSTPSTTAPTTTRPTPQTFSPAPRAASLLSTRRRPWREFLDLSSFSLPYSYQNALSRIKTNLNHFRSNYTIIMLAVLFLSLLYHPVSLIVFILIFVLWYALYFSKEQEHIIVLGYVLDDRVVMVVLSLVTIVALVLTHVGLNVLVALIIVVVVVGLHAAFRIVENLYRDEESVNDGDGESGGLFNVVGGHQMKPYTRF